MQIASIHKAKTNLSDLIKKVQEGEDIIICKAGRPAVKLVKYKALSSPRRAGAWKGQVKIAEDFDKLPQNLLSSFKKEVE
ncbi:MAG: type II toxin-antitoxin system prevent-host-death family antitoxin [Rickettsia endosymbiont of Labidopullus appendiculatus]|uniref:type II toxin-antitoxin system Phd/YefM family antitoxin n=1 Tax=Candidatus Tisiphia endosymbiont of Sialis lutaria TaxID=2029164 RepID=UPI00312C7D17|nr:type II toxin-antitoxin system prevent-host-death family antitoxin [Rickettsia endosymbiont of Labidopullus appendiculatus]